MKITPFKRCKDHEEAREQAKVASWLRTSHPNVLFTSTTVDHVKPMQAIRRKAAGYRAGWPDMFIAEPRKDFHGLFVEMKKVKGGQVSPEQKEVMLQLGLRNYAAKVCHGADEAIRIIWYYLEVE